MARCSSPRIVLVGSLLLAVLRGQARGDDGTAAASMHSMTKVAAERPWEIGVYYPFQYYQTENEIGDSSSFTAVGLGAIVSRLFYRGLGMMASYQADVNAVTSAAIFSGMNLGVLYAFLGYDSVVHDSASFSVKSFPSLRSSVAFGLGQRTFDFRTLISSEEVDRILAERNIRLELEGSGWAPFVRLQIDGRVFGSSRIGGFLQYQQMLPNAVQKTRVTSYFAGISYDFSRLSGAVE